ncbi:MAG TPA: SDR family oxidoreductase [Dehalococcoidales bacterium]|nr:SDR family oxidoreductase [Dehalococcoidales bacterium]
MANMFRVDNRIAVVVGGSGGIGEVLGTALAEYGARLVIAGRRLDRAQEVAGEILARYRNSEAVALQVDVIDENSVAALRDKVMSIFGTVDILVNAQGVNIKKSAVEFPVSDWDLLFNVNVRGTMLSCREFGKIMIDRKKGKIINLSSVRGVRATSWGGNEAYTATKAAIDMMTRSLAAEWAPYKINVNAIAPSTVATRFSESTLQDPEKLKRFITNCPMGRVAQPADLVGACIFLASSASDFMTGQTLYIDGGMTAIG